MIKVLLRGIDRCINIVLVLFSLFFILYGAYGIWDTMQIQRHASTKQFLDFKPQTQTLSFQQLQEKNKDVFAWISIANTNIDYPLVQGSNNSYYVNRDVYGQFSLSGSLFLDVKNKQDFSDCNSIIYGHHMEKNQMFSDLEKFSNMEYFQTHNLGNIYYQGTWHAFEIMAFLHVDAYDDIIYNTRISSMEELQHYEEYVMNHAICKRKLSIQQHPRYLVLSTCTTQSTNGRHVLICRWKEGM